MRAQRQMDVSSCETPRLGAPGRFVRALQPARVTKGSCKGFSGINDAFKEFLPGSDSRVATDG